MDHIFALRFQRAGADQHLEGRFGAKARHSRRQLHGVLLLMPITGARFPVARLVAQSAESVSPASLVSLASPHSAAIIGAHLRKTRAFASNWEVTRAPGKERAGTVALAIEHRGG